MQVFFGNPCRLTLTPCALTIGNFDGVHCGHQKMLERLRLEADARHLSSALLTFEPHPREFFCRDEPPARLSTLRDKLAFLRQSGLVDNVFVFRFNHRFSRMPAQDFMQDVLRDVLHTRYLLIGDDFQFGADRRGDFALLSSVDWLETEAMPSVLMEGERASSSLVRERLLKGDLSGASVMLGRPYQLSGRVIHGNKLGRTLGFPTANVHLPHRKPALQGIFVVQVETEQGYFGGVASLGHNPTVNYTQDAKLEVHLFDFSGDLYGHRIVVHFLKKLRDEVHYDELSALVAQIEQDAINAKTYLTSLQREQV